MCSRAGSCAFTGAYACAETDTRRLVVVPFILPGDGDLQPMRPDSSWERLDQLVVDETFWIVGVQFNNPQIRIVTGLPLQIFVYLA